MNRVVIILLLFIFANSSSFAQRPNGEGHQNMRNKIEAQKISYITQKLDLSPKEAQQFWPLYNELEKKKHDIRKQSRIIFRKLHQGKDSIPEKELLKYSDKLIDLRLENVKLEKQYHIEYKKILPARKILDLYHTEKQFQGMLLRRLKEKGRHRAQ